SVVSPALVFFEPLGLPGGSGSWSNMPRNLSGRCCFRLARQAAQVACSRTRPVFRLRAQAGRGRRQLHGTGDQFHELNPTLPRRIALPKPGARLRIATSVSRNKPDSNLRPSNFLKLLACLGLLLRESAIREALQLVMKNRVVLITGAKGGLGTFVTQKFLSEGDTVVGASRSMSAQ